MTDPVLYPTITIDGADVEVKFRIGDLIALKKEAGIDLFGPAVQFNGLEGWERMLTMISYGIRHQVSKSAQQLADSIDMADFPLYIAALRDSQKKALERSNTLMLEKGLITETTPASQVP